MRSALAGLLLAMPAILAAARADAQTAERPALRVATSGDYAPFSKTGTTTDAAGKPVLAGFDVAVARAYAADRGLEIEWVRFRWSELLDDLQNDRFDVAMSGVTIRPERSVAGIFSVPVASSGAVVIVPAGAANLTAERLQQPGIRIAVNAGGHLEKVSRSRFPNALVTALPENAAVPAALVAGRVDAIVSDSLEAPQWTATHPGLVALAPFTRDRKAYLMPAGAEDRARDLDGWLLEREADGSLAKLRRAHLGTAEATGSPPASPLRALLASIDERLALMPAVAEAKAALEAPVEVPEREASVLAAAVAEALEARCGREQPGGADATAIAALFAAQIEAAKVIQRAHLAGHTPAGADAGTRAAARHELEARLRPALLRIGVRTIRLVACLPPELSAAEVHAATRVELASRELPDENLRAIADAVVAAAARPDRSRSDQ